MKVLLLENIHPLAVSLFKKQKLTVTHLTKSLSEKELIEKCRRGKYRILGVRSKTQISSKIFDSTQLMAVGAFCIGTDQIDLKAANVRGIPIFNAPYSNTRSVAELIIAELIALSRQLCDINTYTHKGLWRKTAENMHELRGKVLGIVGYGHIGSQVSILAEFLGMQVIYYDIEKKLPIGNAQPTGSLGRLLKNSNFVSLHVPDTPETRNMISTKEINLMKPGSFLLNASRGKVVNISALAKALKTQKLMGAAIDVYPNEPRAKKEKFNVELQNIKNVILTPHIGGSTNEAQKSIASEVAQSLSLFVKTGSTRGSVNVPQVHITIKKKEHRFIQFHHNVPGVLGSINQVLSANNINVRQQSLSTNQEIGCLLVSLEATPASFKKSIMKIKKMEHTISIRSL